MSPSLEFSTPISSLTSTLPLLCPIFRPLPIFLSPQTRSPSFNLSLSSSHRREVPRSSLGEFSDRLHPLAEEEEEEEEEESLLEIEDSEDVEDIVDENLELETLEQEAQEATREYSLSLSRELKIEDETDGQKETLGRQKRRRVTTRNIPDNLLPKVAIVGRPNVGKSALFNRLVGGNRAIVVDEPGVTRDRLYGRSFWGDFEFMVVDTEGVRSSGRDESKTERLIYCSRKLTGRLISSNKNIGIRSVERNRQVNLTQSHV